MKRLFLWNAFLLGLLGVFIVLGNMPGSGEQNVSATCNFETGEETVTKIPSDTDVWKTQVAGLMVGLGIVVVAIRIRKKEN